MVKNTLNLINLSLFLKHIKNEVKTVTKIKNKKSKKPMSENSPQCLSQKKLPTVSKKKNFPLPPT